MSYRSDLRYRGHFEKDGKSVQIDVEGPITLDESPLARIAALDGIGISFFMEVDVDDGIAAGRLECILHGWTQPTVPLGLKYAGHKTHRPRPGHSANWRATLLGRYKRCVARQAIVLGAVC